MASRTYNAGGFFITIFISGKFTGTNFIIFGEQNL